jgi:hypothetical protein
MNPQQPVSYNSSASGGRRGSLVTIVLGILLLVAVIIALQQFLKVQDYKKNTDKKVSQAVAAKSQQLQTQAQNAFDAVNTYQYQGSSTYGSVSFRYPKTWSGYVDTTSTSEPINGYFQPGVVPGISGHTAYALRVELLSSDYSQIVQQLQSNVKQGTVTASAYVPPMMNGAANLQPGVLLKGQINSSDSTQNGTMLVIKVRDKTLQISTQSPDYQNDFNNIVLPSLTFAP